MSITLEQIVQTLESLITIGDKQNFTIHYHMPGFTYWFNVDKNGNIVRLNTSRFEYRSMVEFGAIRENHHYVDNDSYKEFYCDRKYHEFAVVAKRILEILNDSETHREAYWVTERLKLPRGPIRRRGEDPISPEVRFYQKKHDEIRGQQNFLMPMELKVTIIRYADFSHSDHELQCMHMAKQVHMFYNVHGQLPEGEED